MKIKYFLQERNGEKWVDVTETDGWYNGEGYENISELINDALGAASDGELNGTHISYRVVKREIEYKDTVL